MEEERPPVVWLPTLEHGAYLLAWLLRDDGAWWAHLLLVDFIPDAGFGRSSELFYTWELCAHSSLIEQRNGWDYSRVPRLRA